MPQLKKKNWIIIIAVTLALGAGLGTTRPWSTYSPLKLNSLFAPDKRAQNFRTMEQVMPYRTVRAASTPFEFQSAPQPLLEHYTFDGQERHLDDFLASTSTTGLLVIKNDAIVDERYLLGATRETRHTSWSVAKSFVSTLIGIALKEKRIRSLDDAISDYAPSLKGSAYEGVPIRHVLQMSSGVSFDETYENRTSDIQLLFAKTFALSRGISSILHDYKRERPSGEVFHYISLDTQALGQMLRELYGKPLAALLEEKLWGPLGMEADAYWNTDSMAADGMELAFCCLNARLRDYAKLGRLYLEQGRWQGQQLLPENWVVEATTPGRADLEPGKSQYGYGPRGYQYQWWIPEGSQREYMAIGVWGQFIYVSEPDRLIIASSSVDPEWRNNFPEALTVFRAIRDSLRRK